MTKLLSLIISALFSFTLMACPHCTSSMGEEKELYIVYVLGGFILLCYIPMYVLWKTIIKYRNNSIVE